MHVVSTLHADTSVFSRYAKPHQIEIRRLSLDASLKVGLAHVDTPPITVQALTLDLLPTDPSISIPLLASLRITNIMPAALVALATPVDLTVPHIKYATIARYAIPALVLLSDPDAVRWSLLLSCIVCRPFLTLATMQRLAFELLSTEHQTPETGEEVRWPRG